MSLPSVLIHDHLDGGLRAETILELADSVGYTELPASDPESLAAWFDQSNAGSLERYLDSFRHTIGVMQDRNGLERVAYEAVIDLATDGVVYAEIRFCPDLHTGKGLHPGEVIEAVSGGMSRGAAETGLEWGLIVDGMRQGDRTFEMARLAVSSRDLGVVGFDLAGPETGHPPSDHLAACRHVRESGLRLTIHAGEAAGRHGPAYIAEAMDRCGAERIGHGVELIADCLVRDGDVVEVGPVASRVRDRQIPLEMCPSSNLATGGLAPEEHPLGTLHRAGFNVTISTDNRLMSNTSMSAEFEFVRRYHDFELADLALVTRRSLAAAFCDHPTKVRIWDEVIAPTYRDAGVPLTAWRSP